MKNIYLYPVMFLIGLLVTGACASPMKSGQLPSSQEAKITEEATAQVKPGEGWQANWDRVLANARKEGSLLWINSGGGEVRESIMSAFKISFPDIKLEVISGKTKDLTQKIIIEQRAGLYLGDSFTSKPSTIIPVLIPPGALSPLEPALIRPDILDARSWLPGQPSWVDPERFVLNVEYSISGSHAINTNLVKPGEIRVLRDLLNPKWKGKVNMIDPLVTHETFFGMVGVRFGWDFWREFTKQEPVVVKDQRLQIERVARGKDALSISPKTELIFHFAKEIGAPVALVVLEDAQYVGGDAVVLLKNAPHPNAAKIFINWLLSKEGQAAYHNAQGTWSARTDVTLASDPLKRPMPRVDYFNSNSMDFILGRENREKIEAEIFAPFLMK